ncbi:MAG: hypothetical protein KA403_08870 [Candidatus Omnitrophica bacterium]|nr:hypothetical protein [Candidatus Omnitrophota bacterium]
MNNSLIKAYKTEQVNQIYNMFFCDDLNLYRQQCQGKAQSPWRELFAEIPDAEGLKRVAGDPDNESRVKILAFNELLGLGVKPAKKELLGIVVEVCLEEGLDTLAAYADGTAHYINYTERMIVWESKDDSGINRAMAELFDKGKNLITEIGPWDKGRLPQPAKGNVRLSFLVSNGLYFGQGPWYILFNDHMGGPILHTASELMNLLVEKALSK